ncbi:hypothetical protein FUAX_27160 [Fulvitalea axinellae]|uniref:Methyltransferase domain-containing protein n=1 Tax=Fulvitalea axinellae TaxID=1182444 RepID=A0AAU9CUW3_9BACT|nr:hypothetical protein FUAX_27160 [Fulvitalea axinellae]
MQPMIPYAEIRKFASANSANKLDKISSFTVSLTTSLFSYTKPGKKLLFYNRLNGFLKILSLHIIARNGLQLSYRTPAASPETNLPRVLRSFERMAEHSGILQTDKTTNHICFSKEYKELPSKFFDDIQDFVKAPNKEKADRLDAILDGIAQDYLFIHNLTLLYNDKRVKSMAGWANLIKKGHLSYEIRLAETLSELAQLSFSDKIVSSFEESYYTRSGRDAFRQLIEPNFKEALKSLCVTTPVRNVLDIGCGFGDYIETLRHTVETDSITGLDINPEVVDITQSRFDKQPEIEILCENALNISDNESYDLILANFVLFYFTLSEQKELFRKIRSWLSPHGTFLVCQYFPDIENMKNALAMAHDDNSIFERIERHYANTTLYANAVWNDALDLFATSEQWHEFVALLESEGLKIESLRKADRFYYSLFITIRRDDEEAPNSYAIAGDEGGYTAEEN